MRRTLLIISISLIALSVNAQKLNMRLQKGSYTDTTGIVVNGLIGWTPQYKKITESIIFQKDKKANPVFVNVTQLKSFVMGKDTFVSTQNPIFHQDPFLKLVVNNNDIKLYIHYEIKRSINSTPNGFGGFRADQSDDMGRTFYFGPNTNDVTVLKTTNFFDAMSQILIDRQWAIRKIKDGSFRFTDIDNLIIFYKTGDIDRVPVEHDF